jgi:short-subunit dehydrogenase
MRAVELDSATVVVTGGSRGIGPHIAAALMQRGARVALVARDRAELQARAHELARSGGEVVAVVGDLTSAEDRRAVVATVSQELGPIDVLVNNAGGDLQREFHNLSEDDIEGTLALNLTSAVILSRLVLPDMLARERGHIVNVSSMAGRTAFPYTEAYAAAKDGLIAFTRVLRGDYRRRGVSASTLILGPVGEAGVGARTAEEVGIKLPPVGLVSPARVGKATVAAIARDKPELVVMPGPGRMLRAVMDRFPGLGPAMNRAFGASETMRTVAEYREREARWLAACEARGQLSQAPPRSRLGAASGTRSA